mmetsp:Transcript_21258/g.46346  ORF Transcript_21258/g.46346 Transcript_21258/m.46346 type:complete len:219 (+) Transcript_21258:249-905(+)
MRLSASESALSCGRVARERKWASVPSRFLSALRRSSEASEERSEGSEESLFIETSSSRSIGSCASASSACGASPLNERLSTSSLGKPPSGHTRLTRPLQSRWSSCSAGMKASVASCTWLSPRSRCVSFVKYARSSSTTAEIPQPSSTTLSASTGSSTRAASSITKPSSTICGSGLIAGKCTGAIGRMNGRLRRGTGCGGGSSSSVRVARSAESRCSSA